MNKIGLGAVVVFLALLPFVFPQLVSALNTLIPAVKLPAQSQGPFDTTQLRQAKAWLDYILTNPLTLAIVVGGSLIILATSARR